MAHCLFAGHWPEPRKRGREELDARRTVVAVLFLTIEK
jgi:hypothetical protein